MLVCLSVQFRPSISIRPLLTTHVRATWFPLDPKNLYPDREEPPERVRCGMDPFYGFKTRNCLACPGMLQDVRFCILNVGPTREGSLDHMTNSTSFWTRCCRAARAFARPELMIALMIIGAALATPSVAMQGDTIADRVLGQADFVHNGLNLIDASGMLSPQSVAIDTSVTPNRLYVSDNGNSRVLGYRNVATFVSGGAADLVIGQPDFQSGGCNQNSVASAGPAKGTLCLPLGIAVDASGNLYVADSINSRVVEYNTPFAGCGSFPCVGGSPTLVFGQGGNFTTDNCDGGGESASTLCFPEAVAVDSLGNLYVADEFDNRVLEYNTPLTSGTTASLVFGQGGSFAGDTCSTSSTGLCGPDGLALDASGDLYVADAGNNRVLEYTTPLTSGTTADLVLGQADFVSGNPGATA